MPSWSNSGWGQPPSVLDVEGGVLRGELRVVIDLVFPCPKELHNQPDVFWHREWCGEVMCACVRVVARQWS